MAKKLSRKKRQPNKTLGNIPTIVISLREEVDDGISKL